MSRSLLLRWVVLVALLALASGCGADDGAGRDEERGDRDAAPGRTQHDDDRGGADGDSGEPTPMPEHTQPGEQPPIRVTSPAAFQTLVGSFVLAGTAQVHEGTLAWAILDARLKPMQQGTMTATCGAPCRGKFRTRISLAKVPLGSWELHVWSPNTSDDGPRRLHDTMVPITVSDRITPGTPPPGTVPPGGPPQG